MPRHDCHPLSNYCAFRLSASFWTESRDCTTARQGATTMVACSFSNRSACGCTSPQPGTSTPSTHHGWGDLRLVWENSCGENRKLRRRAASIVLHFVYERGMMEWRVNTVNPFPAEYADPFVTSSMGLSLLDLGQFSDWNEKIEWLSMQKYVTINWEGVVG